VTRNSRRSKTWGSTGTSAGPRRNSRRSSSRVKSSNENGSLRLWLGDTRVNASYFPCIKNQEDLKSISKPSQRHSGGVLRILWSTDGRCEAWTSN
jgi:hypothetical protein